LRLGIVPVLAVTAPDATFAVGDLPGLGLFALVATMWLAGVSGRARFIGASAAGPAPQYNRLEIPQEEKKQHQ
jgi:hypothetical protein